MQVFPWGMSMEILKNNKRNRNKTTSLIGSKYSDIFAVCIFYLAHKHMLLDLNGNNQILYILKCVVTLCAFVP